ncbi:hypothetical protein DFH28DRAFT_1223142 [Melampsora americana]|nr:hypothetical protein DFH28DRAFT_1223142 [Melampsora americana]
MKSLRILAPWGFLIICGLSDWSQSHPTPDWEGGLESITRDMNDNDKGSGVKAVFADAHSGHKADPLLKTASFVNNRVGAQNAKTTKEAQKVAEDSQNFRSLAGQVERMSPNKVSQPAKVAEGKNQTFRGKFRTIFLSWPVKFWESIKNWFSKFFQPGDKNLINPAKDAKGFQTNLKEEPIPNTVKGLPTLSEVSKIKIPAQEPIKSRRGSNNLNKMTRQAPVGKGQFYTTPLDDP